MIPTTYVRMGSVYFRLEQVASPTKSQVWKLVAVTYGLVIATSILALVAYFQFRDDIKPGDSADANPLRRMRVGTVWIPVYEAASWVEPTSTEQNDVHLGSVKFKTQDPPDQVLRFYADHLREGGFVTTTASTVQAVRSGGKTNVTVSVNASATDTTGEIRTFQKTDQK
jgi:hypothetical protein